MKLITIQRNVMSGQAKRCIARIQVGYTAIFILPRIFDNRIGMQVGLFVPKKINDKYIRIGFWFTLGLHKDVSIYRLPKWQQLIYRTINFRTC